jgi:hypothetical protein
LIFYTHGYGFLFAAKVCRPDAVNVQVYELEPPCDPVSNVQNYRTIYLNIVQDYKVGPLFLNPEGVSPVIFLKVLLKEVLELNPDSKAMPKTEYCSDFGSNSKDLASSTL